MYKDNEIWLGLAGSHILQVTMCTCDLSFIIFYLFIYFFQLGG